jgi:Zn-dependent M16 (insulinase) family peptidase
MTKANAAAVQQNPSLSPDSVHPAFQRIRSEAISSLNIVMEEYHHKVTGAVHYHLCSENTENVFLVALRTVPMDSTGVAHILEHTALCGSKNYPVRDPFFMMIRRSLNTFMNAFTSSDWTAYPFASKNKKDFNNLLKVYLDAVFFSRLHELDFAQEGHRFEFSEMENPESELQYKGVVYNEMKGAMSSTNAVLWQTISKYLFPTTTYHYNSGGEPDHIPDLSYNELKTFYKSHYHPSNSVFMTFGDIPASAHHRNFEELALAQFSRLDINIAVANDTCRLLRWKRITPAMMPRAIKLM